MLYSKLHQLAKKVSRSAVPYTYGRHHFKKWVKEFSSRSTISKITILDIGCGQGDDLLNVSKDLNTNIKLKLLGIESYPQYQKICNKKGINAVACNIENEKLPMQNKSVDIVIINQVLEHTKDTFWVLSEISRVLKPQGLLLLGIPNLAAWHDRFALLLGQQPTSINFPGPHVRGITKRGMIDFAELDGYFQLDQFKGSAFYPFPPFIGQFLAFLFPNLATSIFFNFVRTTKKGKFIEVLKTRFYETNYYQGK